MNTSTVAIAAALTGIIAAMMVPRASSAQPVSVTYGCNSATFTNRTDESVRVSHGVPDSTDVQDFTLAPRATATVTSSASNFRWWAHNTADNTRIVRARTGVDLTSRCDGRRTAEPTPRGDRTGGLANTGETAPGRSRT